MGLKYENFTDVEWDWVLLMERLRGLTLKEIKSFIGCSNQDLANHWYRTRTYREAMRSGRLSIKERVYLYMDVAMRNEEPMFTPALLADLLGSNTDCVQDAMDQWYVDVENHDHFPWRCGLGIDRRGCGVRGSWVNPILENGLCFQCNAEERGWPAEMWRTNGQMVALLFEWGLIGSEMIAERYL